MIQRKLLFSEPAKKVLLQLESDHAKIGLCKQVKKTLGFMETNLQHTSLHTHKFNGIPCSLGQVFESYVQNNTPGAYRIFWTYGPGKGELYVLAIVAHP